MNLSIREYPYPLPNDSEVTFSVWRVVECSECADTLALGCCQDIVLEQISDPYITDPGHKSKAARAASDLRGRLSFRLHNARYKNRYQVGRVFVLGLFEGDDLVLSEDSAGATISA